MKLWTIPMLAVVVMFVAGCGGNGNPVDDEGQAQDVIHVDIDDPDVVGVDTTVTVDVQEDTTVAPDVITPEDTAQPDTNVQVDEGQPVDTVVGCPEGVSTGAACYEAGSCALQCDDLTFKATCTASADQTVKDAIAAFETCLAGTECTEVFAGEQISECVTAACAMETAACFVGDKDCRDIWTCRKDCDVADPSCPMRCFASGTALAQENWITYKNCIMAVECATEDVMENGWPIFTCEQNARGFCTLPYSGCFPPT